MKNKILLLAIIILLPLTLLAQSAKFQDVVYLKNGSVIHGTIIQDVPNQSLKIKTRDGDIFVYQYTEIDKVTSEPVPATPSPFFLTVDTSIWSGYINYTEAFGGIGVRNQSRGVALYGFQTINGYQHKKLYSVGIGVGLDFFPNNLVNNNNYFLPLFIDGRFNLNRNHLLKPYIEYEVGYGKYISSQPIGDLNVTGGLYMNPSIGLSFQLAKKNSINIGLGFMIQNETLKGIEYSNLNGVSSLSAFTMNSTYDFLQLKLGFSF